MHGEWGRWLPGRSFLSDDSGGFSSRQQTYTLDTAWSVGLLAYVERAGVVAATRPDAITRCPCPGLESCTLSKAGVRLLDDCGTVLSAVTALPQVVLLL